MQRVTVPTRSVRWPDRCPVCGGAANESMLIKTTRSKIPVPLPGVIILRSGVASIRHPICARHQRRAVVASRLSRRSLFNLLLGVVSVFCVLMLVAGVAAILSPTPGAAPPPFAWVASVAVFPAVFWALFFWSKAHTPVKFEDADENKMRFLFQDNDYARDFRSNNVPDGSAELYFKR